ncbi:hypothetical protein MKW94_020141 [Papaver nudicaule]|uniref:Cupin type-1 domain-containing protein n=1 Tax=Papaver nudicaule TaxID=74823 RepID=A0AA41UWR4_PAPNU|nr:hypothetical protein [Papaver nudicaule]
MEIDLTPKSSKSVYGGEGGSYFSWSPSDYGYPTQRGMQLPYLVILFTGDTSKGHKAGEFTEFALTGANGILTGFTSEFVGRAWDLEEDKVKELVGSQKSTGVIEVKDEKGMTFNCLEARLDVNIKNGGHVVVLNTKNLPSVEQVGLGADLVRINAGSMCSPGFSCDSAYPVTYIVQVRGRAQIFGLDGKPKMEIRVKAGNLLIIPGFLVVSKIADEEGTDWFSSIISIPNPIFCHLAGRTSDSKALNPQVLVASFNVAPEAEKHFRSKRTNTEIFFLAPNKEE